MKRIHKKSSKIPNDTPSIHNEFTDLVNSVATSFIFYAVGQFRDVIESLPALCHETCNFLVSVHDSGMVAPTECFADPRKR